MTESDPPPRIFYSSSTVLELFGAPENTVWGGCRIKWGPTKLGADSTCQLASWLLETTPYHGRVKSGHDGKSSRVSVWCTRCASHLTGTVTGRFIARNSGSRLVPCEVFGISRFFPGYFPPNSLYGVPFQFSPPML